MGEIEGDNLQAEMRALAERAAGELIGTCTRSLSDLAEEYGQDIENSPSFCARLDELAFLCVRCNWWCGQDECNEVGGEWACDDCTEEDSA